MTNTVISLKKSATPSAQPTNLANGELAINFADGKLFYKNATGQIVSFTSGTNSFGTVNANGTLIIADTTGDILTLEAGNNITITADAINDKITISASGSGGGNVTVATSQIKDLTSNDYVVTNVSSVATVVDSSIAIAAFNQANAAFDQANTGGGGGGTLTTFTSNVGDGSANTFNVSHQLNSYWLLTSVRELSTGDIVYPDMRQTTANNLVITFVDNPTANQYALLVAKVA